MPFREAHETIAQAVRFADKRAGPGRAYPSRNYKNSSQLIDSDVFAVFNFGEIDK